MTAVRPTQDDAATGRAALHVCLVSAQATPNLLPLLDPGFAPARLVMLVSDDMRERARWLADVVQPRGIAVQELPVPDPWDPARIADNLVGWLAAQEDAASIALNVTGGTKPMAMGAQQAFAAAGLPVFYVHHGRDEVLWLMPRRPPRALAGRLRLEPFLHAHGWQVRDRPPPPRATDPQRRLTEELVRRVGNLQHALGRLNWYAHRCDAERTLELKLEPCDLRQKDFTALVDEFDAAGACALRDDRLRFPDEAARFFCNGGWLELHVAAALDTIRARAGVQDWAAGLKVRTLDNRLHGDAGSNELDLAFLARNRLHIVECKTRSFRERHSAAEAVYKLDSLTALGGLNTRGMLVSYRTLADGDRQRAHDLGIRTVVGSALANLRDELLRWIGSAAS